MKLLKIISSLLLILLVPSCKKTHSKSEIEAALQRYNTTMMNGNGNDIASLFTPDGETEFAQGRTWIKRVNGGDRARSSVPHCTQIMTSRSIDIIADSAYQTGTFHCTYPQLEWGSPDSVGVHGDFKIYWIWYKKYGWLIKKYKSQFTTDKPLKGFDY